jgi:hypothetical protein
VLEQKGRAGINRAKWDLRYESPRVIALRTVAPANRHIWDEPRFRDSDSRPITHWGSKPAEVGPIVAPGSYSVRLTVDGQSFVQPLTVLSDPRAPATAADIGASVSTLIRIRDDISHAADTVNQIEWLRKQLEVVDTMLRPARKHDAAQAPIAEDGDEPDEEPPVAGPRAAASAEAEKKAKMLAATGDLDKKLQALESTLVSSALRNSDDKYFIEPYGVYLNLIWLNAEVGTGGGDVAGSADFAPTDAQLDSLKRFEAEAAGVEADYRKVLSTELPALNRVFEASQIAPVTTGAGGP